MATRLRASNRTQSKVSARAALQSHYKIVSKLHLRQLFADDPQRGERMTAEAAGIYLDYSKNRITAETLNLLFQLAAERGLQSRIDATPCFSGQPAIKHDRCSAAHARDIRQTRCPLRALGIHAGRDVEY